MNDSDAEIRGRLADAVAAEAAFGGWSRTTLLSAASQLELPAGEGIRLFPGGPIQVLAYLSDRADQRTMTAMEKAGVETMKVRDRIRSAVRIRLENHAGNRESVRRGLAMLSLPFHAATALRLLYRTVDALWYAAGDASADFSFYTKRATLAGVYSATLLYWLNDRSEDSQSTWAFLDRRINEVMAFEKFKGRIKSWKGPRTVVGSRR